MDTNYLNALSENATFWEVIVFLLVGIALVLGILILLSVLTYLMGQLFKNNTILKQNDSRNSMDSEANKKIAEPEESDDGRKLIAILTAAASETLNKPVRVTKLERLNT